MTYFVLLPDAITALVWTRQRAARIIRMKDGRWWCDCPTYRAGIPGLTARCAHVLIAKNPDVKLKLVGGKCLPM